PLLQTRSRPLEDCSADWAGTEKERVAVATSIAMKIILLVLILMTKKLHGKDGNSTIIACHVPEFLAIVANDVRSSNKSVAGTSEKLETPHVGCYKKRIAPHR